MSRPYKSRTAGVTATAAARRTRRRKRTDAPATRRQSGSHRANGRARERALITGASSGIGLELARVFAANGFDVVLVARRRAALAKLARELREEHGCNAVVMARDLTNDGAATDLRSALERRGIEIDVLVNNAGVAVFDRFVESSLEDQLRLISLNVVALTSMTRTFLAPMLARGRGRILNVASVAAFQPTPWLALYGASKAFVLSLSESLAVELAGTGVSVTALCPGFTDTPLVESAERELHKPGLVPRIFMLDAAAVAREGYEACMAGRTICVNGLPYEIAVYWERMQPRWLVRSLGGLIGRRFEHERRDP
jgi:short-subunit dehydrogenase